MSERFASEIRLGGTVAAALVPELCAAIAQEGLALDWAEGSFEPRSAADLLDNRRLVEGTQVLRLCDEQARWGSFPQLETFLKRHGVAFDRLTEGGCGYDAERESFRPGSAPLTVLTTVEGRPLVAQEQLASLGACLRDLQAAARRRDLLLIESLAVAALQSLDRAAPAVPPLPALEVARLARAGCGGDVQAAPPCTVIVDSPVTKGSRTCPSN